MATYVCPRQHDSTEPDYCSECGARIESAAVEAPIPAAAPVLASCPECGAAREQAGIAFCEICGYNFETGACGETPVVPVAASAPTTTPRRWSVVLSIDPSLHEPGSPPPPADYVACTIALDAPVSLVGRRSAVRGIYPEIDLSHDSAVSHRHALLQFDAAGAPVLRDIGASNGTRLNGRQVDPLKDHPLAEGDEITLGHWSRLVLKAED